MNRVVFALCLAFSAACLCACSKPAPHKAKGVYVNPAGNLCDDVTGVCTPLGIDSNPMSVKLVGASSDGGAATPGPVDTLQSELLNTVETCTAATTACLALDGGTHSFVRLICQNSGTTTGWCQLFCGDPTVDAGGLNAAATVPTISLACPAGTYCVDPDEPQPCNGGAVVYSSSTQNILTVDAGVPVMGIHVVVRL